MQKISTIVIFILAAALIAVSVLYFNSRNELAQVSGNGKQEEVVLPYWELTDYPNNLFEGTVVSLNLSGTADTMIIDVDASKILSGAGTMRKIVRIGAETELIFHEVTPESDRLMQLSELEPGDYVVVAIEESAKEEIASRDTFTATKITKIRAK